MYVSVPQVINLKNNFMRKCKVFFTMALLAFLIGMSVLSCQSNDDDNYNSPKEQNLTAVDLFIASEAYQNLEKEIRKNMRRKRNAISRLSREEKERYHQLKIEWLNPKTRAEANVQLNLLLGYDEEADYDRISSLARKVYGGTKFTQLELMKALQKRQMKRAVVNTRTTDTEDLETCKKGVLTMLHRVLVYALIIIIEILANLKAWRNTMILNIFVLKKKNSEQNEKIVWMMLIKRGKNV